MQTHTLTLIRGLPGSGKSTLARSLVCAATHTMCHYEADMYFINAEHVYVFDHNSLPQAHAWCVHKVKMCMEGGHDVVVSNTFVRLWEMDKYKSLAKRLNFRLKVITAQDGNGVSIHDVPTEVINRMRDNWESLS